MCGGRRSRDATPYRVIGVGNSKAWHGRHAVAVGSRLAVSSMKRHHAVGQTLFAHHAHPMSVNTLTTIVTRSSRSSHIQPPTRKGIVMSSVCRMCAWGSARRQVGRVVQVQHGS